MNIAQTTIAKRTSVWVMVALMLIGGYISYLKLGRFEDPEFVIRQSVIVTPYPGATAQEVADEVTDVIEALPNHCKKWTRLPQYQSRASLR